MAAIEWRRELDYLLFLLFVGLLGWLAAGVLDVATAYFSKVITVVTLVFGLMVLKNLVSWDDFSEKLYDVGVYSLFIVVSSFFLRAILGVVGLSEVYAAYLEGFGYFLAFVFILLASLVYLGKRLARA